MVIAGYVLGGSPLARAADEATLASGERVQGDLLETALVLSLPEASYRVSRETVWRIVLGRGTADWIQLRNGSRLSGLLGQAQYTFRLRGGDTRVLSRGEIDSIALDAPPEAAGTRVADVLLLANGDHVYGEVVAPAFDLLLDSGTTRLARDSVRAIVLGTAVGDSVYLANGNRLSGVVSHAAYTIRTPDGQALTFPRSAVLEVLLGAGGGVAGGPGAAALAGPGAGAGPAAPGAGASGPGAVPPGAPGLGVPGPAVPGPSPGGPYVAAVPPETLPAPVRTALRDIHFEFDRWGLVPEAQRALDELAAALKPFPSLHLLIEGHADERGTAEYNLALGERRALAAKDYLVSLGVDAARLDTISYGKERPFDPRHDEIAWALNRRTHFVVRSP